MSELVVLIQTVTVIKELYIDGSFVTDKSVPGDVDVVAFFDSADFPTFAASPHATHLADRKTVKSKYKVDLLLGPNMRDMIAFFQGLRPELALQLDLPAAHKKGILRVSL
jgi:hypothetical protein